MNNDLFGQLKQFVISERGDFSFPLTSETTLEGDLKIYGDDAVEFLVAFGKRFNIDVSGFDAAAYFRGEGWSLLPDQEKISLTLGNLYTALSTGVMYETDSFKQIVRFVKDERWGLKGPFVRETELYRDLGLWGDDARKFIDAFAKKFGVDTSEFKFEKYFPLERRRYLSRIFYLIMRKKIMLNNLEEATARGKLM